MMINRQVVSVERNRYQINNTFKDSHNIYGISCKPGIQPNCDKQPRSLRPQFSNELGLLFFLMVVKSFGRLHTVFFKKTVGIFQVLTAAMSFTTQVRDK